MTGSLPDRPDIDQLRRRAKELRDAVRAGDPSAAARVAAHLGGSPGPDLRLSGAQLTIAREHGFASWPALRAAVEGVRRSDDALLPAFLQASLDDRTAAEQLLQTHPGLAALPLGATVLGDATRVAAVLAANPEWWSETDDERGWSPLLYACYSRWSAAGPAWADGSQRTVRLLLTAGASPDSHNGRLPNRGYRSALHGSAQTGNTAVCGLLLERGANAEDRTSLGAAAEAGAIDCVRLLLEHGASMERTWSLEAAAFAARPDIVAVMLDSARRRSGAAAAATLATNALGTGIGRRTLAQPAAVDVVRTLLDFGADPNGVPDEPAPISTAVRAGRPDVVSALQTAGAATPVADVDWLVGACVDGDAARVDSLLAADPSLTERLVADNPGAFVELADAPSATPIELMLRAGVPPTARNELGETALHTAAFEGRLATVRLLLDRGADIDALDDRFSATALSYASVGSGAGSNDTGDWVGVVRLLMARGSSRTGAWVADQPPSREVAAVLTEHGVGPTDVVDAGPTDPLPSRPSEAAGERAVLDEVADQLRDAYVHSDMELFRSLLHPNAVFGAGPLACHGHDEIVARWSTLIQRGLRGEITEVESGPGTLIVTVRVAGRADGARDPAPEMTYQRFSVADGLITAIQGHPDLASARRGVG